MSKTVKKNVVSTQVHGYDLIDGEVKPVTLTLPGAYTTDSRITREIRRERPKFIVESWTTVKQTYEMPVGDFVKVATLTDTQEF